MNLLSSFSRVFHDNNVNKKMLADFLYNVVAIENQLEEKREALAVEK